MTETDLTRRVTVLENRLDYLDQHGTRGVGVIQVQLMEMSKDIGKVEHQLGQQQKSIDAVRSGRWATFTAYAIALLPLYILLFIAILGGTKK